jgi:putative FmdB family regulatory protein
MPIYEYQCSNCHHHVDFLQKMSDEPIKVCPACHQDTLVKEISAAGFQLKGTGWYVTDFKNQGSKSTASEKPADKSEPTPASTTKGDNE